MIRRNCSVFHVFAMLAAGAALGLAGCGPSSSAKHSVDEILKESGKSRGDLFPLAGRITVDGQVPETGGFGKPRLVVLLFDQSKLDAPPASVPKAICDAKGEFAFGTYDTGDGVAPGKYVLALVVLRFEKKKGYIGGDGLRNLYNDPSANLKVPELLIDHHAPGRKDYAIDLKLAGRDPVAPGPNAVTKIN
jgi:hypothetical protein